MSRTRRRLLLGLVAALFLLAAGRGIWLAFFCPPMVRAYSRLRLGMTRAEVEEVIGMPPEPRKSKHALSHMELSWLNVMCVRKTGIPEGSLYDEVDDDPKRRTVEVWVWKDEHVIEVAFDAEGKVVGFYLLEVLHEAPPSFLERLRAWIGL